MHISDGVLSAQVLISGAAVAAGCTTFGLKKMDIEKVPRVAVMTAAFFVSSLIHIPVGPSSVHLLLGGLMGLLLGWTCFPAILIGLLLQSLLFQYGGITVLGVTTVNIGVPALLMYLLFHRLIKNNMKVMSLVSAALAGGLAVLLSALLVAFTLVFSGEEFITIAKLVVVAHLPVMVIEGMVNVFVIILLKRVKPEILEVPYALPQKA